MVLNNASIRLSAMIIIRSGASISIRMQAPNCSSHVLNQRNLPPKPAMANAVMLALNPTQGTGQGHNRKQQITPRPLTQTTMPPAGAVALA
jgi:hypothetical protein